MKVVNTILVLILLSSVVIAQQGVSPQEILKRIDRNNNNLGNIEKKIDDVEKSINNRIDDEFKDVVELVIVAQVMLFFFYCILNSAFRYWRYWRYKKKLDPAKQMLKQFDKFKQDLIDVQLKLDGVMNKIAPTEIKQEENPESPKGRSYWKKLMGWM